MAMRWRSCDRRFKGSVLLKLTAANVTRSARLKRSKTAVLAALATACVSTVTRYYLPDAHNPRFDFGGATQILNQYLRVQCPERVAAKKSEAGDIRITIEADTGGAVTQAELTSSTGDEVLDGVFGTVAAQLKADSLRATGSPKNTRHLRIGYSCAATAPGATIELLPR